MRVESSPTPREPPLAAHLLLDLLLLDELVVGAVQLMVQAAIPVVGCGRSSALAQQTLLANRKTRFGHGPASVAVQSAARVN